MQYDYIREKIINNIIFDGVERHINKNINDKMVYCYYLIQSISLLIISRINSTDSTSYNIDFNENTINLLHIENIVVQLISSFKDTKVINNTLNYTDTEIIMGRQIAREIFQTANDSNYVRELTLANNKGIYNITQIR
jgi:hypothetical protein